MRRTLLITALSAVLVSSFVIAQPAQSDKQAAAVAKYRQAIFTLLRSNMGALGAMARGNIPFNPEVMETRGQRIEQLATMIPDYFIVDTREFKVNTEAKPDIWDNKADFNDKVATLIKAAKNLQTVAASKDEANYKSAVGGIGQSCKGCHDVYKVE